MTVKELLLALNLLAQPKDTEYNLQYEYKYNSDKKSIYVKICMLKFIHNKLIHKIAVYGEIEAIKWMSEEMKLYTNTKESHS